MAIVLGVIVFIGEPYTWMLLGFASIVVSQLLLFMCYFSYKFKSFYGGSSIRVRLSKDFGLGRSVQSGGSECDVEVQYAQE